jgi:26S proteasome regulatory subunit N8
MSGGAATEIEPPLGTDTTAAAPTRTDPPQEVQIHPLVLLSAVDHYVRINNRISSGKRVVGILLGNRIGDKLDINNSFAVPFEEDASDPNVWFVDGNYIQEMFFMFKKVWSKTRVVGWYSSGPKICRNDLAIHGVMKNFCPNPVYTIIEVDPKQEGIPAASYRVEERIEDEASAPRQSFTNVRTSLSAIESEEIGVEQLLRDLTDSTVSTLSTRIKDKQTSLTVLASKLIEIRDYLDEVIAGKLRMNPEVLYKVQEIFNVLPNLHTVKSGPSMIREVNDIAVASYVGSLVRCVLAIGNLISNKKQLQATKEKKEKDKAEKEKQEKEKAEAEKAEKEKAAADTAKNASTTKKQ